MIFWNLIVWSNTTQPISCLWRCSTADLAISLISFRIPTSHSIIVPLEVNQRLVTFLDCFRFLPIYNRWLSKRLPGSECVGACYAVSGSRCSVCRVPWSSTQTQLKRHIQREQLPPQHTQNDTPVFGIDALATHLYPCASMSSHRQTVIWPAMFAITLMCRSEWIGLFMQDTTPIQHARSDDTDASSAETANWGRTRLH